VSVMVHLECDGCFAKAEPFDVRGRFVSFSGHGHGFGWVRTDKLSDNAPEGWIVHDPLTHCTYCPECWSEIRGLSK